MTKSKPIRLKFSLDDLKSAIGKHLLLEDTTIVAVVMAVILANLLKADPIWLLLIGPPSSAKTELLNTLDGLRYVKFLSSLTPQTLISGQVTKNKSNPSLLPKLNGKILVVKEFTTVLSMKHEARSEILSQLREVYDGKYTKSFGTGKTIDWSGHVGFLGACTPVYDRHYAVIGAMGDRFLLFRTQKANKMATGMKALNGVGLESTMRTELKAAVGKFLEQFNDFKVAGFQASGDFKQKIVGLAAFCADLRCPVERSSNNQCILYEPDPEGTPRLSKQLYQLGIALSMVHGEDTLNGEIYAILRKIALDLLTVHRRKIIQNLYESGAWEQKSWWCTTTEVAQSTNMPASTAKLNLEDLMAVGVLRRDLQGIGEKSGYRWQIRAEIAENIGFADLFPE